MEIIRIQVKLDGDEAALSSLKSIDAQINKLNKKTVNIKADGAANEVDNLGNAAKNTATQSKLLGDTLSMIKFTAIAAAIGGTTAALKNALSEMKSVDTELTNIQKVSGMTGAELGALGDKAYSTASKYGVAADEYLSAVYTFQKAGLGDSAAQLGELATKTMLVGDTTAGIASQFLIATNAAWGMEGSMERLSTVVDEADYINNNYATSLDKLAAAMPIVASTSANLGMSVEETMAVIGTITSLTQESGAKAATAWRALAMNITGELGTIYDETGEAIEVTTESVESISDALKIYGNDAVKAAQATGQIINPMEAVKSLAEAYRDGLLTDIELENILMNVGGKLRTNQLTALVKDLASDTSMYRDMLEGLGQAAGTADAEIATMLSSWQSKTQILSNTWTEFVQKSISSDSIKGLLDGATKLLDILDNLGNAATLLGGVLLQAFSGQLASGIANVGKNIQTMITAIKAGASGVSLLQKAFFGLGAAITVISLVTMGLKEMRENAIEAASEASRAASQQAEAYQSQADQLEQLKNRYVELASDGISSDEMAEIKQIQYSINGMLDEQYGKIDLINGTYAQQKGLLEANLNILREQARQQTEVAKQQAEIALIKSTQGLFGQQKTESQYAGGVDTMVFNRGSSFKKSYDDWGLNSVSIEWGQTGDEIVKNYDDISDAIANMTRMYDAAELASNDSIGKMYSWLTNLQNGIRDTVTEYKALKKSYDDAMAAGDTEAAEAYADQMDAVVANANSAAEAISNVARAKAEMDAALSKGPAEDTDFNSITSALKTFNEEVDANRVNSKAFWASAEFLLGPEKMAELVEGAGSLAEAAELVQSTIEQSMLGEVFDGLNQDARDFLDALWQTADAEGNVADGAARITQDADGLKFWVEDVNALADAWGMTPDQIYAALRALEAFGAYEFTGDTLLGYLDSIGIATENISFDSIVQGLAGIGENEYYIQNLIEKMGELGLIDLTGIDTSIEGIRAAMEGATSGAEETQNAVEEVDNTPLSTVQGNLDTTTAKAGETKAAADEAKGGIEGVDATSLGAIQGQFSGLTSVIGGALSTAQSLSSTLESINGRTYSATVNVSYQGTFAGNITPGFAEGTDSAPGGPALVGDEYSPTGKPMPELIADRGRMMLAGVNGPEIVNLNPGARVFTADETRDILSGRIPAFGVGGVYKGNISLTTKATGGGGGGGSSSYSGGGGSSSYSSGGGGYSAAEAVEDVAEAAEEVEEELSELQEELGDELEKAVKKRLEEIKKVRDARIQAIRDEAKAEEDRNTLAEKYLDIMEATEAYYNAKNERNVRIFNAATGQWEWVANAKDVKAASEKLSDAQTAFEEEQKSQQREKMIAAIEADYDELEARWEAALESLEPAIRDIADIAADLNANGTAAQISAAAEGVALDEAIRQRLLIYESLQSGGTGLGGTDQSKQFAYIAGSGTSDLYGTAIPQTSGAFTGTKDGGATYIIDGIEISGDRAETLTIASLARSLGTLSLYNNA